METNFLAKNQNLINIESVSHNLSAQRALICIIISSNCSLGKTDLFRIRVL
jgi:hypothetical protein